MWQDFPKRRTIWRRMKNFPEGRRLKRFFEKKSLVQKILEGALARRRETFGFGILGLVTSVVSQSQQFCIAEATTSVGGAKREQKCPGEKSKFVNCLLRYLVVDYALNCEELGSDTVDFISILMAKKKVLKEE